MTTGLRVGLTMTLAAALTVGYAARAQDGAPKKPRPQPGADAALDNEIDALLRQWHKQTNGITALYTEFTRTMTDKAFGSKQTNTGSARFKHPSRARMNIRPDQSKKGSELLLLTERPNPRGKQALQFYHYKADERQLHVTEFTDADLALRDPQEEGPLRLMFGIKPDTAHARYKFEIQNQTDASVTIRIEPRLEEDRQEYLHAIVELDKTDYMPKKLIVHESRETVVQYDFKEILTNVNKPGLFESLPESNFDPVPVETPPWKVTRDEKSLKGGPKPGTKTARRDPAPPR